MVKENKNTERKTIIPGLDILIENLTADEVLEREVVAIGNGAHINIPLKHLGKMAKIIIKPKKEENKKE